MKNKIINDYPYFDEQSGSYRGDPLQYQVIPHLSKQSYTGLEWTVEGERVYEYLPPLTLEFEFHPENYQIDQNLPYYPVVDNMKEKHYLGMIALSDMFKWLQLKMKESEAAIESSYDGIYITTPEGKNVRMNKAIERLTGFNKDQIVGKNIIELKEKGMFNDFVTPRVVRTHETHSVIQRMKTGKETLVTGSPIFDENGRLHSIITNVRDLSELNALKNELEKYEKRNLELQNELKNNNQFVYQNKLVYQSEAMDKIVSSIHHLAHLDVTVCITGESGVGKENVAELIYQLSGKSHKSNFYKINCAAIPKELLESELFGYAEGAFSGAKRGGKTGLFEAASHGTLLLDEIGDMPLKMQAKLLRFLQDKEIMRLGSTEKRKIDTRIIAASNKNLELLIKEGAFREDLYFRLNVIPIYIPPLRERKEDIEILAYHFLELFNGKYRKNAQLPLNTIQKLKSHDWPGNVRELANLIERFVIFNGSEDEINHDLGYGLKCSNDESDVVDLKEELERTEKQILIKAFQQEKSSYKVARKLNVSQSYISRRIKKYDINK